MFDSARLLLFLTAAVLLAVAPGPGMLYVLARSLAGGKREGVLSAVGTFLGGMVHVFAAALGVSVILARSALALPAPKGASNGRAVGMALANATGTSVNTPSSPTPNPQRTQNSRASS